VKGMLVNQSDLRVVQLFLSPSNSAGPGIFEVSNTPSGDLVCDCPGFTGRKTCKHTKFVRIRQENNNGVYPLEISTRATKEEAAEAAKSNKTFRDFVVKYGKIEVF
jgi:hypothetical protein